MPEFRHYQWTRFNNHSLFAEERMIFINSPLDNDVFAAPEPRSDAEIEKMNRAELKQYFTEQEHWIPPEKLDELGKLDDSAALEKFQQIAKKARERREQELSLRATPHLSAEVLDKYAKEINAIVDDLVNGYQSLKDTTRSMIAKDLKLNLNNKMTEHERLHKIARSMIGVEVHKDVLAEQIEKINEQIDTLTAAEKNKTKTKQKKDLEQLQALKKRSEQFLEKSIVEHVATRFLEGDGKSGDKKTEIDKLVEAHRGIEELDPIVEEKNLMRYIFTKTKGYRPAYERQVLDSLAEVYDKKNLAVWESEEAGQRKGFIGSLKKHFMESPLERIKVEIDSIYKEQSKVQKKNTVIKKELLTVRTAIGEEITKLKTAYDAKKGALKNDVKVKYAGFLNDNTEDSNEAFQDDLLKNILKNTGSNFELYQKAAQQAMAEIRGFKDWKDINKKVSLADIMMKEDGYVLGADKERRTIISKKLSKIATNLDQKIQSFASDPAHYPESVQLKDEDKTKIKTLQERLKQSIAQKTQDATKQKKEQITKLSESEKSLMALLLQEADFDEKKFKAAALNKLALVRGYHSWGQLIAQTGVLDKKTKKKAQKDRDEIETLVNDTYVQYEANRRKHLAPNITAFLNDANNHAMLILSGEDYPLQDDAFTDKQLQQWRAIIERFQKDLEPLFTYMKQFYGETDNTLDAVLETTLQKFKEAEDESDLHDVFADNLVILVFHVTDAFLKQDAKKRADGEKKLSNKDILILADQDIKAANNHQNDVAKYILDNWKGKKNTMDFVVNLKEKFEEIEKIIQDFDLKNWANKFNADTPETGKKFDDYLLEENAAVRLVEEMKRREAVKNAPKTEVLEEPQETPEIVIPLESENTAPTTESIATEVPKDSETSETSDLVDNEFKNRFAPIFTALNIHCAEHSAYENFMTDGLTKEEFKTRLEALINNAVDGFMSATQEGSMVKRQKKLSPADKFGLMKEDANAYSGNIKQSFKRYFTETQAPAEKDIKDGFAEYAQDIEEKFQKKVLDPYVALWNLLPDKDKAQYDFAKLVADGKNVDDINKEANTMKEMAIATFFGKSEIMVFVEFISAYDSNDSNYVTELKDTLKNADWRDLELDPKLFKQELDRMKKVMKESTAAWLPYVPVDKRAAYTFNDTETDPQKLFTKYEKLFEVAGEHLVDTYAEVLKIDGEDIDLYKLILKSNFASPEADFFETKKLELDQLKKQYGDELATLAFNVGSSCAKDTLESLLSNADNYQKEWNKYSFFNVLNEVQKNMATGKTTWRDQFKEYANQLHAVDISRIDNEADKTAIQVWTKHLEELALSTDGDFGDLEKLHLKLNEIQPGLGVDFGFGKEVPIKEELGRRFYQINCTAVELLDRTIHIGSAADIYDPVKFEHSKIPNSVPGFPDDLARWEIKLKLIEVKAGRQDQGDSTFMPFLENWKKYLDKKADGEESIPLAGIMLEEITRHPDSPNWFTVLQSMAETGNMDAQKIWNTLNPVGKNEKVPAEFSWFYYDAVSQLAGNNEVVSILLKRWKNWQDTRPLHMKMQKLREHIQNEYPTELDNLPDEKKEEYVAYWRKEFYKLLPALTGNFTLRSDEYNFLQSAVLKIDENLRQPIRQGVLPQERNSVYNRALEKNQEQENHDYLRFENGQKLSVFLEDKAEYFGTNESLISLFPSDVRDSLTGVSATPNDFLRVHRRVMENPDRAVQQNAQYEPLVNRVMVYGPEMLAALTVAVEKRQKYKTYFENPERQLKLRRMKDSTILPRMRRVTKLYNMFGKKIQKYKTTTGAVATSAASMLIAPSVVTGVGSMALSTVSMGLSAYGALLGLPIIGAATAFATVSGAAYQLKNKGLSGLMAPLDGLMQFSQGVGNMLSNSLGVLGAAKLKPMLNMLDSPIFTTEGNIDFSKMKEGDVDVLDSIIDQWDQLEEGLEEAERLEKINTVDLEINTDKFGFEEDTLDGMMQSVYKDEFGFEPTKGLSDEVDKKKLIDMNAELDSIGQKYDVNLVPHEGDAPELYRYLFRTKPAPGIKLSNNEWQKKEDEYFATIEAAIKKEKEALLTPFETVMSMSSADIAKNIDKLIKEYDSKINRKNEEKKSYAELFGKAKSIDKEGMATATTHTKSIEREIDDLTKIKSKLDSIKEYLDHESKVQSIKRTRQKLLDKARKLELPKALNEAWAGLHTLEQEYSVLIQQVSQFPGGELSEEQQKELQELTKKMTEKAQKIEEQQAAIGKVQKESGISGMGAMSDIECFLEVRSKLRNKFEDREKDISTWVNKKGEVSVDDIADPSKRKAVKLERERRLIAMAKRCPELLTDHHVARAVFNLTLGKAVPNLIKNNQAYNLSNWAKSVKDQKFPLVSSTDQVKTFIKKGFSFLTRFVAKRSPVAAIVAADEIADRLNVQNWLGERYKNAAYKESQLFWGAARLARYGLLDLPAKALPWLSFGVLGDITDDRTPLMGLNASASYRKRAAAVENLHKFKARASHLKPKNAYPYPEAIMMNYLF